jgi:acyl-CoA thioesterase FadM
MTMFFDILRADDQLRRATAMLTVVCVSRPEMTKMEIPADVRAALKPFVA